jgi:anti-anti-sigma factor
MRDEFQIQLVDDITIVKVDLVTATLRDARPLWNKFEIMNLFERSKIIIDLSTCSYIDSTFIGMLVKIFKRISESQGQMMIVFPLLLSPIQTFRFMGLTKIVNCFDNLDEAIETLRLKLPIQEHYSFNEAVLKD